MTHLKKWLLLTVALAAPPAQRAFAHNEAQTAEQRTLNKVGFDQKLDGQLPLAVSFKDETGRKVQLREYFGSKPVVILPIYYRCSMLCPLGVDKLLESLKKMKFTAGKEFTLLTVSIDPKETPEIAAEVRAGYLKRYGRPEATGGWHFLTGEHAAIDELTQAIGFRYEFVKKTGEYAHPDGFVVATPEGKVARYFFRLEYPPRDVQFGLMEASHERIGSPLNYFALSCFHYDPVTGKYNFSVMKALRIFSVFFVLMVLGSVGVALRMEKRAQRAKTPGPVAVAGVK